MCTYFKVCPPYPACAAARLTTLSGGGGGGGCRLAVERDKWRVVWGYWSPLSIKGKQCDRGDAAGESRPAEPLLPWKKKRDSREHMEGSNPPPHPPSHTHTRHPPLVTRPRGWAEHNSPNAHQLSGGCLCAMMKHYRREQFMTQSIPGHMSPRLETFRPNPSNVRNIVSYI